MIEICGTVIKQDISLSFKLLVPFPEKESHRHTVKGPDLISHITLGQFPAVKLLKRLPQFLFMAGKCSTEHIRLSDLIRRRKWSCIPEICKRDPLIHNKSPLFRIPQKRINIQHLRSIRFSLSIQAPDTAVFQTHPISSSEMNDREKPVFFLQFRHPFMQICLIHLQKALCPLFT